MNIAFFGTPPFTIEFLETLVANGYSPTLIVTSPDRPSGRGMVMQSPIPKIWADEHDIKVLQPEIRQLADDDAFFAELSHTPWDLFVVVAYGKIMPQRIIDLPKYGTINVHYSLLPQYRGATPTESAILHGDAVTGVTIQQMKYKLDSGDILSTAAVAIDPTDTTPILRDKLNAAALELLPATIANIFAGNITPIAQDESRVTTCTKISKEDGEIYLSDDPVTNDRKYRAYFGWPGSYSFDDTHGERKRVKITKAHLEDGTFVIDEVVPENGKRMRWQEYQKRI